MSKYLGVCCIILTDREYISGKYPTFEFSTAVISIPPPPPLPTLSLSESKECQSVHYLIAQLLGIPFQLVVWLRANIPRVRELCWLLPLLLCIIHSIRWEILPMLWWGQYCCLVNIFIKSSGWLECCDGNRIITSEISDLRDEMINFYSSDCDENQSEISDSSDFIVFPNIKWSSS